MKWLHLKNDNSKETKKGTWQMNFKIQISKECFLGVKRRCVDLITNSNLHDTIGEDIH